MIGVRAEAPGDESCQGLLPCAMACLRAKVWGEHLGKGLRGISAQRLMCDPWLQDPYPLSGLKWGASFAISGDASVVLVGAPGQVISGALTAGADRAIDGKVNFLIPIIAGEIIRKRVLSAVQGHAGI